MYIYDVEYVRGGQGGALTLEIGQNRGFGRGLAQPSSPHSLTWWVKWLNPFAYHLATLGDQFQSKEPLSNVYGGWLGANNHQKVPFSHINISLLPVFNFNFLTFWQKMDFWPVLQFWLQRKNGRFTVPTLRFGSVVSQGHFFGDPNHLTLISYTARSVG